jgi:hypothetical protein
MYIGSNQLDYIKECAAIQGNALSLAQGISVRSFIAVKEVPARAKKG